MKKLVLFKKRWLLVLSLGILFSCKVTLISEYDEITDKKITELQEKTSTVLSQLEDEIGKDNYENYKKFYQEVRADLNTLEIRANAIDKNQITINHIAILKSSYDTLESLHKQKINSLEELNIIKSAFNTSFIALVKLQMAKKQGKTN
ncbi:hypothetical protein GCM10007424_14860 [Flavobacterium suaedae]|uniref:Lipoprotein n=1 Tax=Flavobacterium suaedae TaxID=1767027 RepID=A0ABQ1JRR7_9FLAO|nr:hypothetical protein [Flavobacterium suaedae]GGB75913.1 hypothetical protein GCM10007424_14860 [Flavobacterium suaedae]